MDPRGNIYRAPEDEIPGEDKARLDGYLTARAEADKAAHDELHELRAKVQSLEADGRVDRVTRLLEDRLDFWLPGGEGLREALPNLAREIVALADESERANG